MARKRIPASCRIGKHGPEVYTDALIFVETEKCKRCGAIIDPVMAELWAFEERTHQDLQDIKPLRERIRRLKRIVTGEYIARNLPLPNWA